MPATARFALPDVGEGLTEAEIVAWKVEVGDRVDVNQVIVEIETAKSLVELPSPFAGVVEALLVAEGDTVAVGTPIISVAGGDETLAAPLGTPAQAALPTEIVVAPVDEDESGGAVLVGYGTGGLPTTRRRQVGGPAKRVVPPARGPVVPVKPPVRRLARELGVDLAKLEGTGTAGEITRADVERVAEIAGVFRNVHTPAPVPEREERIPVRGVRKAIATAMVRSAFTAPHVSLFVDIDATRTMEYVRRLKSSPDFADVRVSPLLVVARAVLWAVRRNPTVNSTWTDEEILVHHFVNLGIAAATPRGLVVPNVKEAQSLSMHALAAGLDEVIATARTGRSQPDDMSGGTITITNLGSFGMDTGTPILNPGEVAIVALGAIKPKPWVVDGEIGVRDVVTLGASFDHRVVDGDVASRFLADVASVLQEPALLVE